MSDAANPKLPYATAWVRAALKCLSRRGFFESTLPNATGNDASRRWFADHRREFIARLPLAIVRSRAPHGARVD